MEKIIQHQTIEYALPSDWSPEIPVILNSPSGHSYTLLPFQKYNTRWYVRFSVSESGQSMLAFGTKRLKLTCVPYTGRNPLYTHGPVVRMPGSRYLSHTDGTPFFYLADTWWYAMTNRMSKRALATLLADRKKKGFTAVQCVIGGAPEVSLFSPETANSGGLPFTKDLRINPAYFEEVDNKILKIVEAGIVPCIFGSWGHHIDIVGVKGITLLWNEIIARYASYPVMFCLTGEADIFPGAIPDNPFRSFLNKNLLGIRNIVSKFKFMQERKKLENRIASWNSVGVWIKNHDPFNRILTVHPHRRLRSSVLFRQPSWLDVDSIQSGHSDDSIEFMKKSFQEAVRDDIPILNLEPWYEGILGNFGANHQRHAFWISVLSGACGHSYGSHGVWQMASGDNFMSHWGSSEWNIACSKPGSTQLGLSKQFLFKNHCLPFVKHSIKISSLSNKSGKTEPLCGVFDEKYCIIYIPDIRAINSISNIFTLAKLPIHETWYDPQTMKKVSSIRSLKFDAILVRSYE